MTKKPAVEIALIKDDPWLEPYAVDIQERINYYRKIREDIEKNAASLKAYAEAYQTLGFNYDKKQKGW